MATHSGILAWNIPRTEEPGGFYSPWGCKESDVTERVRAHTHTHTHTHTHGPDISGGIQYLSFCDWFISVSMVTSGFIHTVACV